MNSFIESKDEFGLGNPHRPNSPSLQGVVNVVSAGSTSSPLGRKKGKTNNELKRVSAPLFDGSRPDNDTYKHPGTPQIERSSSQRQEGAVDHRPGWESAPPHIDQDDEPRGLRERWEEQSNLNSLFSESVPATRPTSRQTAVDLDDDNQSTKSDSLGARRRPHKGRSGHKVSESSNFVGRNRNKLQSRHFIDFKDGKFSVPGHETGDLRESLITHAPRNGMPENATFRQDPFETTSEEASPRSGQDSKFLHSSFPYRQGGPAKMPTHIERAAFHMDAVRKLSPEKYDPPTSAGYRDTYPRIGPEPSMQHPLTSFYAPQSEYPLADLAGIDSDTPSQEDELEQQQQTPRAASRKVAIQDGTMVLNPPKATTGPKPPRNLVVQDAALSGSPMARVPTGRQPGQKKRRRSKDYDDAALQRMSFAELQNEPFDHDPTREVVQSPAKPSADNLDDRLGFYQSKDEIVQAQFFASMSVRDWEDSGDWFLGQFGNIIQKMREARQAKRRMVEDFENEVSAREEFVRHKKEGIDRRLSKLKQDGDAMMRGKELQD